MKRFQLVLLSVFAFVFLHAASCDKREPVQPIPVSVGGSTVAPDAGAGGISDPWQGGGSPGVAGAAGAAQGGTPSVAVFPSPCEGARKAPMVRPSLSGWHKDPERAKRRRVRPTYSLVAPSVFRGPNFEFPLDQGSLGSCTGNAVAHCLSTSPFAHRLTEFDAVRIYSRATEIDPFKGVYPPTDTGSNGSSAWRAAVDLGYYSGKVSQIETLEELQGALHKVPVALGIDWWSGMFTPTPSGELQMTGTIEGGHELAVVGWEAERKLFWVRNSWGSWGVCRGGETGYAYLSAGTLQKLLNAGGELDAPSAPN